MLVYIGTYTDGRRDGIYVFRGNAASGALTPLTQVAAGDNPSFLAADPKGRHLYAVNEIGEFGGKPGGAVTAFSVNGQTGALTRLNQQWSGGAGPCYVSVDPAGRHVLVANYGSGSVAVLPIEKDGRLGEATAVVQHRGSGGDPQRQEAPHAHSILASPDGRFVFAADLGLDRILIYRLDDGKGTLEPNDPPAARVKAKAGPRHFAFHPAGRWAYVINELDSTVTAFAFDAGRGELRELQTLSTLPDGFRGNNSCADLHVAPSGRFLYGSNRGHDSIALFEIDAATGRLKAAGHEPTQGKTPRNFALDPVGAFLYAANQDSDSVVTFRVDARTGRLAATGQVTRVPRPVCVAFLPAAA
jgi:6-phosphogluconolactonase